MQWALNLAENGWLPDPVVRRGIRRLLDSRIQEINSAPHSSADFAEHMRRSPLAVETDRASPS